MQLLIVYCFSLTWTAALSSAWRAGLWKGVARKTKKSKRPDKMSIFISYVREDINLAASVHAELAQLFSFTPVEVFRDVGIPPAANYQLTIDQQLDNADILLVLVTGRLKPIIPMPAMNLGSSDTRF
jgi:hypothetical protein